MSEYMMHPESFYSSLNNEEKKYTIEGIMNNKIKNAVEEYQCPGCVCGSDISCFEKNLNSGEGCGKHVIGTMATRIGHFMPGMPVGFTRIGHEQQFKPNIYETFNSSKWTYNKFNIPVWKYLNESGHTLVRGMMPRLNLTFIHIFLEDCRDKIDCLEITHQDIFDMD